MVSRTRSSSLPTSSAKKAQNEIAVLLQQLILATVASIRVPIGKMLRPVQLDGQARSGAQQVHFERSAAVKGNRQPLVEAETSLRLRQSLQSSEKESFGRAARAVRTLRVRVNCSSYMKEQARERRIHTIAHEPLHAARIISFPDRIRGQDHVVRPAGIALAGSKIV